MPRGIKNVTAKKLTETEQQAFYEAGITEGMRRAAAEAAAVASPDIAAAKQAGFVEGVRVGSEQMRANFLPSADTLAIINDYMSETRVLDQLGDNQMILLQGDNISPGRGIVLFFRAGVFGAIFAELKRLGYGMNLRS